MAGECDRLGGRLASGRGRPKRCDIGVGRGAQEKLPRRWRKIGPDVIASPHEPGQHLFLARAIGERGGLRDPVHAGREIFEVREPQAVRLADLHAHEPVGDHGRLAGRVDPGFERRRYGHRDMHYDGRDHGTRGR